MRLLGFTGNLLIGLFCLAMAAFYFWIMKDWADAGEYGPGLPTVIGVGLFALLWFSGAIRRVFAGFRMVAPPKGPVGKDSPAAKADDDGPRESGFDPDAALARYMAARPASPSDPEPVQAPRGFGRRGL